MGAAKMPNLVSILFAPDFVKETTLSTLSLKSLLRRFLLAVTSRKWPLDMARNRTQWVELQSASLALLQLVI